MKVNELMIGDWASLSETEDIVPCVVTALHPEDLFVIQPGESAGDVLSYDTIYPIPLTAEILEKNGFIKVNTQRYDYGHPDTDCYVKVNPKKNMVHVNGKNANSNLYFFSFVHELQHALRLCGLNDLAGNFKI